MMGLTDTHFHFTDQPYVTNPEQVFELLADHNVQKAIVPTYNLESCQKLVELKTTYSSLPVAIGIHPLHLSESIQIRHELSSVYDKIQVSAVGEIGLDKRLGVQALKIQERAFTEQLDLAAEWNLPLIIHCVKAHGRCLQILKPFLKTKPLKGVIHRVSCSIEVAKEYYDLGLYFGLGPDLFNQKRSRLQALASWIPANRIVLETDAPYGKNRDGSICNPWDIYEVLESLAALRKIPAKELEQTIIQNTYDCFGI